MEQNPRKTAAFRRFAEAVIAFSDEPGPENLERYLAASHVLEQAHRRCGSGAPGPSRRSRAAR